MLKIGEAGIIDEPQRYPIGSKMIEVACASQLTTAKRFESTRKIGAHADYLNQSLEAANKPLRPSFGTVTVTRTL